MSGPDYLACDDCVMVIANADTSGIDDPERLRAVLEGVERIGPACVDEDEGFRWAGCDVCRSPLGGNRHGVMAVGS